MAVFITSPTPSSDHNKKRLEVKYNTRPINNCICDTISVNKATRNVFGSYSFFEITPEMALITAKIKTTKTM